MCTQCTNKLYTHTNAMEVRQVAILRDGIDTTLHNLRMRKIKTGGYMNESTRSDLNSSQRGAIAKHGTMTKDMEKREKI